MPPPRSLNQPYPIPGGTLPPWEAQANHRDESVGMPPTESQEMVGSLVKMARRLVITAAPPAHIRPTVWSNPIDLSARVSVAGAVSPTYTDVLTFRCPEGYGARIEQYGVDVQDPAYGYDGSLLWAFKKNGALIDQGMSEWGDQRGSTQYPRKTVIILDSLVNGGDLLTFCVRRAVFAGAPQFVVMNMRGWTWRKRNTYEGTQGATTAY